MIIVLKKKATNKQIKHVEKKIVKMGLKPHVSRGVERTIIGAIGDESLLKEDQLKALSYVEKVMPILKPYKLVSREFKKEDTVKKFQLMIKTFITTGMRDSELTNATVSWILPPKNNTTALVRIQANEYPVKFTPKYLLFENSNYITRLPFARCTITITYPTSF